MSEPTHHVLPADDPRVAELLGQGWQVTGESWGARLTVDDRVRVGLHRAVHAATRQGLSPVELDASWARHLGGLERATHGDHPDNPATMPDPLDEHSARKLWRGSRIFGVIDDGRLVAATTIEPGDERAETGFTAVAPSHRGRGLAQAVKAASILALLEDGVTHFATGGSAENPASLAVNRALGYEVTERWVTVTR